MKGIFFVSVSLFFWSGLAAAQMDVRSAKASTHNFSVLGSMAAGGFSLGAGYEYMMDGAAGVGAHIRTFAKKTATTSSPTSHDGLNIVGVTLGHHFFKGKWDLAFTPSFNIVAIDSTRTTPDDTTSMGPGMSVSLLWVFTDHISAGFDWSNYWVWFDEDFRGLRISDMAVKVRASF
jgi:hypothetical protein